MMPVPGAGIGAGVASAVAAASMAPMVQVKIREMYFSILTQSQSQSCIEFKKFTRSSNELTFNSSSKFPSLSFMSERKERNFELELKVSSIELLLNFLNFIQL